MYPSEVRGMMIHYLLNMNDDEALAFVEEVFSDRKNLEYYYAYNDLTKNERRAIACLFEHDALELKAYRALQYDECCFEAAMIIGKYINDDDSLLAYYEETYQDMMSVDSYSRHALRNVVLFSSDYANLLLTLNYAEEALKVQDKAIELDPRFFESNFYRYISTLAKLKNIDKIVEYMETRPELFNDSLVSLETINILLHNGYEFEAKEALDIFDKTIKDFKYRDEIEEILNLAPELRMWMINNRVDKTMMA